MGNNVDYEEAYAFIKELYDFRMKVAGEDDRKAKILEHVMEVLWRDDDMRNS